MFPESRMRLRYCWVVCFPSQCSLSLVRIGLLFALRLFEFVVVYSAKMPGSLRDGGSRDWPSGGPKTTKLTMTPTCSPSCASGRAPSWLGADRLDNTAVFNRGALFFMSHSETCVASTFSLTNLGPFRHVLAIVGWWKQAYPSPPAPLRRISRLAGGLVISYLVLAV